MKLQIAKTCKLCDRIIGAGQFSEHLVDEHRYELEWAIEAEGFDFTVEDMEEHHDVLE